MIIDYNLRLVAPIGVSLRASLNTYYYVSIVLWVLVSALVSDQCLVATSQYSVASCECVD